VSDDDILGAAAALAESWRGERRDRFDRRHLDPDDFAALSDAGFLGLAVPVDQGGVWASAATSTRLPCEVLRTLASGDPSPALVAAMHPAVLAFWLGNPDTSQPDWEDQRRAVFATAYDGAQWGTVTSEPGSGGDIAKTKTRAQPTDDAAVDVAVPGRRYLLTGDKHFGSGTGICSFMLTTAVPDGEDEPAAFFLDTRGVGDGTTPGFTVSREWDGVGMGATQSHGVRLVGCPAVRFAWDRPIGDLVFGAAAINVSLFTGVVLGVVDEAMATAEGQLAPKRDALRAYEQVEWSRACTEHWLAAQAFEGMLRAIESDDPVAALKAGLRGKLAVAELAEEILLRVTRVVGGGTFSAGNPFSSWFEDVRALGFLRPPWGLTLDSLFATTFE
jgi:alkylation response protein AidB-like acyl-CoA dehydrogenase